MCFVFIVVVYFFFKGAASAVSAFNSYRAVSLTPRWLKQEGQELFGLHTAPGPPTPIKVKGWWGTGHMASQGNQSVLSCVDLERGSVEAEGRGAF